MANQEAMLVHHEHDPAVAEHFDSVEQQHETNVLGMWVFLATEVMLFGGMFLAYTLYSFAYPTVFREAALHQNLLAGSINTGVLIVSSLLIAMAVHSAQLSHRRALVAFLLAAAALGVVFLGIKGFEYYQHYEEHLVPGLSFSYAGPNSNQAALFFFLYFAMTGVHAVHMTIGVVLVLIVAIRAARGARLIGPNFTGVEMLGLYWHFVDVIWVFLFPLLYLIVQR